MTYISCDEHMVGLVGELACYPLSDLVDGEPLCAVLAMEQIQKDIHDQHTYALPI